MINVSVWWRLEFIFCVYLVITLFWGIKVPKKKFFFIDADEMQVVADRERAGDETMMRRTWQEKIRIYARFIFMHIIVQIYLFT